MAIRNIVKRGDPILSKVCKPVEQFDDKLAILLNDMRDTLHKAEGLGLAAPQVGILKRVCIVEYEGKFYELVNPVLVKSKGKCMGDEGCLSVDGFRGLVERPREIDITYFDRSGNQHSLHAEGYFARVFLHEMDHLDGVLFCDKMVRKVKPQDYE